jgi:hypothetical protein
LANPKIGWGFGWLTFCYLAICVVAVDNALATQAFMPLDVANTTPAINPTAATR